MKNKPSKKSSKLDEHPRITVRLPHKTLADLKVKAKELDRTVSWVVLNACRTAIKGEVK